MGSKAMNPAFIHNNDPVCILNTGNPLRNDQFRGVRYFLPEGSPDLRIRSSIDRTGAVIQDQYFRFFQKCPCNSESLLLSAGHIISSLLNVRLIFHWKSLNKFIRTGEPADIHTFLFRSISIAPP